MTEFITTNVEKFTDSIKWITKPISLQFIKSVNNIVEILVAGEYIVYILLILLLGLKGWKSKKFMSSIAIGIFSTWLFHSSGLWESTASTLALVFVSVIISALIGIPVGIVSSINGTMYRKTKTKIVFGSLETFIMSLSAFMQTMPSYVYLIPAYPLFGLGYASACFATVVFSTPPIIRMVHKGFLDIPREIIEAANVDGSSYLDKLIRIQFPLSLSTIAEGINQSIMMALSMSVIASLIGAKGLGSDVWRSIQRLRIGDGLVAGMCMVFLALILDRLTSVKHEDILEGSIK